MVEETGQQGNNGKISEVIARLTGSQAENRKKTIKDQNRAVLDSIGLVLERSGYP